MDIQTGIKDKEVEGTMEKRLASISPSIKKYTFPALLLEGTMCRLKMRNF